MIPYGRQNISDQDIDEVINILKSDYLTQGPKVPDFEAALSQTTGAEHSVAMNSATSALHVACMALGLGPGDVLWTSPITFVASANCALYCGAKVDFVDIDLTTFNLCPNELEKKLVQAETSGTLPKIVVPVHLCGQSCDMAKINELSKRFGFHVIEDASHAIGAHYQNQPVGNCRFSDITVFSFHPVKIVTTAEGGVAQTNDPELADRMRMLRSHGITRDQGLMTKDSDGPWYYQQLMLGYNYRMTELQAGLGLSQLSRLNEFVATRNEIAQRYDDALSSSVFDTPKQHADCYSARHLYVLQLDSERSRLAHMEVFEFLRSEGIGVNLHYIPVHLQPYYSEMGFKHGDFPNAEAYYQRAISIPVFPTMSEDDIRKVVQTVLKVPAK